MSTQPGGESPGIGGLNSYQEIANLEHRFIELLDQRDTVAMAALFRHGTFELNHAPSVVSAAGEHEVRALLQELFPHPPSIDNWSRHMVSNMIIEIDESMGTASMRLYSSAWGVRAGQPGHFRGLGRHVAELARIDGKWLFKRLTIHADVDYPYPAN